MKRLVTGNRFMAAAAVAGGMPSNRLAGCRSSPPALRGSATGSPPHGAGNLKGCASQPACFVVSATPSMASASRTRALAEKVEAMGLSVAEVAFHDDLANNQSAQDRMGDEVLMKMARELVEKLRGNLSIDWQ